MIKGLSNSKQLEILIGELILAIYEEDTKEEINNYINEIKSIFNMKDFVAANKQIKIDVEYIEAYNKAMEILKQIRIDIEESNNIILNDEVSKQYNIYYDVELNKYYKLGLSIWGNKNIIYLSNEEVNNIYNRIQEDERRSEELRRKEIIKESIMNYIIDNIGKIQVTVNGYKFTESIIITTIYNAYEEGYLDIKEYYKKYIRGILGSEIDRRIINRYHVRINNILNELNDIYKVA